LGRLAQTGQQTTDCGASAVFVSTLLGDTSTLADPAVVEDLIANRQNRKG